MSYQSVLRLCGVPYPHAHVHTDPNSNLKQRALVCSKIPQCALQWLLHPLALPGKVRSASSLASSTDPIPTWGLIFQYFSLHCIYLFCIVCMCLHGWHGIHRRRSEDILHRSCGSWELNSVLQAWHWVPMTANLSCQFHTPRKRESQLRNYIH